MSRSAPLDHSPAPHAASPYASKNRVQACAAAHRCSATPHALRQPFMTQSFAGRRAKRPLSSSQCPPAVAAEAMPETRPGAAKHAWRAARATRPVRIALVVPTPLLLCNALIGHDHFASSASSLRRLRTNTSHPCSVGGGASSHEPLKSEKWRWFARTSWDRRRNDRKQGRGRTCEGARGGEWIERPGSAPAVGLPGGGQLHRGPPVRKLGPKSQGWSTETWPEPASQSSTKHGATGTV